MVVESKTPHNMKTIKPFEVKISENHPDKPQTWRVFLDREFTAKLRVIKKDSDTKQTVLVPNAEFKIFNLDKNEYVTQYTTYPSKVKHTSFFTDEDGDLILPRVIGGGNPVLIQSMTNTRTEDVAATVEQIQRLAEAGCEIIRCAVPTMEAARAFKEIKKQIGIPLVADIHFDYRLAIAAMENGADKIRINSTTPGTGG